MAISEESRHRLYQRLEGVLGREEATVLMEHLPPVGWADVATKRDLDALEQRVGLRFERVDEQFRGVGFRFDAMDRRMDRMDERLDRMDGRLDRMDERFDRVDGRFDELRSEFRTFLIAVMSMMVVLAGAVITAFKI